MNLEQLLYILTGVFLSNVLISVSFHFGHKGLKQYGYHAVKILTLYSVLSIYLSISAGNHWLYALGVLSLVSAVWLRNVSYYLYIQGISKFKYSTKWIWFNLLGMNVISYVSLSEFYQINSGKTLLLFYVIELLLKIIQLKKEQRLKGSNLLIFSLAAEVLLIVGCALIVVYHFDWSFFAFLFWSVIVLISLGLLLLPNITAHFKNEKTKKVKSITLRERNLKELQKNTQLENEITAAHSYSQLISLDTDYIGEIIEIIRSNLTKNQDESSLLLTRLATHLRNHVYFKNEPFSTLRNEFKLLSDFNQLCDSIGLGKVNFDLSDEHQHSDISLRSHVVLPLIKSCYKSLAKKFSDFELTLTLAKEENNALSILITSSHDLDTLSTDFSTPYIQSRLIEKQKDYGQIIELTEKTISLNLHLYQVTE